MLRLFLYCLRCNQRVLYGGTPEEVACQVISGAVLKS